MKQFDDFFSNIIHLPTKFLTQLEHFVGDLNISRQSLDSLESWINIVLPIAWSGPMEKKIHIVFAVVNAHTHKKEKKYIEKKKRKERKKQLQQFTSQASRLAQ